MSLSAYRPACCIHPGSGTRVAVAALGVLAPTLRAGAHRASSRLYWSYSRPIYSNYFQKRKSPCVQRVWLRSELEQTPGGYVLSASKSGRATRKCSSWRGKPRLNDEDASSEKYDRGQGWTTRHERWEARQRYWEELMREYAKNFGEITEKDPAKRYDMIKVMIEKDPYMSLFGWREARGVWNPWRSLWGFDSYSKFSAIKASKGKAESSVETSTEKAMEGNDAASLSQEKRPDSSTSLDSSGRGGATISHSFEQKLQYSIDPITLRKVPLETTEASASGKPKAQGSEPDGVEIPVKKFRASADVKDNTKTSRARKDDLVKASPPLAGFAAQPWVQQEKAEAVKPAGSSTTSTKSERGEASKIAKAKHAKIESSLDRLNSSGARNENKTAAFSKKDQDKGIDSLRASDVRASVGQSKDMTHPLDDAFEAAQTWYNDALTEAKEELKGVKKILNKLKEEIIDDAGLDKTAQDKISVGSVSKGKESLQKLDDQSSSSQLQKVIDADLKIPGFPPTSNPAKTASVPINPSKKANLLERIDKTVEKFKANYNDATELLDELRVEFKARAEKQRMNKLLADEVAKQKSAFSKFESFRAPQLQTSETVSGASRTKETESPKFPNANIEQKQRDRELVRQIRDIYEDTYGTISTQHRQSQSAPIKPTLIPSLPESEQRAPASKVGTRPSSEQKDVAVNETKADNLKILTKALPTHHKEKPIQKDIPESFKTQNVEHQPKTSAAQKSESLMRVRKSVPLTTEANRLAVTSAMAALHADGYALISGTRSGLEYEKTMPIEEFRNHFSRLTAPDKHGSQLSFELLSPSGISKGQQAIKEAEDATRRMEAEKHVRSIESENAAKRIELEKKRIRQDKEDIWKLKKELRQAEKQRRKQERALQDAKKHPAQNFERHRSLLTRVTRRVLYLCRRLLVVIWRMVLVGATVGTIVVALAYYVQRQRRKEDREIAQEERNRRREQREVEQEERDRRKEDREDREEFRRRRQLTK